MIFKIFLVVLGALVWSQRSVASQPERGVLNVEDLSVILSKWYDLTDALKLDDLIWDAGKTNLMISMHDSSSAIYGKYRTYQTINPDLIQIPDSMNRLHAAESASLHAVVENLNRIEAQWKSRLNLEDEANYNKLRGEMDAIIAGLLNLFSPEEVEYTKPLAATVVAQLVDNLRKDPAGQLKEYQMGNLPGQFRYEPENFPDSLIQYVGAKPYATCDFEALTAEMKKEIPPFDSEYVTQVEEIRCLGRSGDNDGNSVLGPNCARTINDDELKSMTLGYASFDALAEIRSYIAKSRNYGFLDSLRVRTLSAVGGFDSTRHTWTVRPFLNHWRPASAMRSGSGGEVSLWPIETNWNYRDPDNFCEPEYPSGNASNVAMNSALIERLLSEDPRNAGLGRNIITIDGEDPKIQWQGTYKNNNTEISVSEKVVNLDQFSAAIEDARVFSGAHFRFSVRDGTKLGNRIGHQIWNNGFLARVGGANDKGGAFLTEVGTFRFCAH